MPQTNSGIWNQPMPGARSLWIVAMKFRPVKMDEKPRTKAAMVIRPTAAVGGGGIGRVEGPAGIDAADDHGGEGHDRADAPQVEARQVQAREGDVFGAEHQRQDEIASDAGMDGMMNRNTMMAPCSVKTRL